MALTKRDKKLLPFLLGGIILLCGIGAYAIFDGSENSILVNGRSQVGSVNDEHLSSSALASEMKKEKITLNEYHDEDGNVVQEISAPEPILVRGSSQLLISDDNKEIIELMRDNLLIKIQTENARLKASKQEQKGSVKQVGMPSSVVSGGAFVKPTYVSTSNFTEIETTQPLLSSTPINDRKVVEQFARIKLASLTVSQQGKGKPDLVSAWIRIDGKPFKAEEGGKVSDFEFKEITESYVSIRYLPANVTKKLGHTGFRGE